MANGITNKELFKRNIKSIEIGTHNYCNRTCNFCPLSRDDVNRRDKKNTRFMEKSMFQNIMEQLAEIDFDGRIDFSRYHEPLSFKDSILEKCKTVKSYIPKATISINTNSDYLNREYVIHSLVPHDRKMLGQTKVEQTRWITGDPDNPGDHVRINKRVTLEVRNKILEDK